MTFRRGTCVSTLIVIALVLCGVLLNSHRSDGMWTPNVNLQVFMSPKASASDVAGLQHELATTKAITHCTYLDAEASAAEAKTILAGEPTAISAISGATLPTVFRCQLRKPSNAPILASVFAHKPGVYQALFPGSVVRSQMSAVLLLQFGLFGLAAALLLGAIGWQIANRRRDFNGAMIV